jgi:outer membrane lipoprotein-sorting protein
MKNFLRTASTRRLLAVIGGCLAVAIGGTAIAVAAGSGGPVPRAESLAKAVRGVLDAPAVTGITADISFTNHLIGASNLGEQADPLLTGATGRLWLSTDQQALRLELQGNNGDAEVVVDGQSFWVYDPTSNTVYEGQLPADATKGTRRSDAHQGGIPGLAAIQSVIASLGAHLNVSGAIPGDVAGQPTYTVHVSPRHDGGLLGGAAIAFDALHGVPLRFDVYATGDSTPVIELTATNVSFGDVPASSFAIPQPAGAQVVQINVPSASAASKRAHGGRHRADVSGVKAVARHVHFALAAPAKLAGLPRQSVGLLDWGGTSAALVTYGQGIGAIAVIEQPADSGSKAAAGPSGGELSLPTVSINGATGSELDTALGTMIRFTRGGVAYTVLGSVPPVAAEAAARGL